MPPEFVLVQIARFGTALAQRLADLQSQINRLRVRAIIHAASAPLGTDGWLASIELEIRGEGPRLSSEQLRQTATDIAAERGLWHGPSPRVPVMVGSVEALGAEPSTEELRPSAEASASDARASPIVQNPSEWKRPRLPGRSGPLILAGTLAAVLIAGFIVLMADSPAASPQPVDVTSVPTSLPTESATTAPTPAPTVVPAVVTVIVAPAPTVTPSPRTIADARFASGRAPGWPDDRQGVAWFAADGYHLRARTPGRFVAISVPGAGPAGDVRVLLQYRKVDGPSGGGVGVILRDQASSQRSGLEQGGRFYVLEASDQGEVGIWRREEDRWVDLVSWTRAPAVRSASEGNLLEARASGPQLTLLVNGVETVSTTDPALTAGGVGVFLGGDNDEALLQQLLVEVRS
jgi:hypothetical protein